MGSGGRRFPGFLLTSGGQHLLIDCGPSTLPALKGCGFEPRDIQTILISHLHGDHFGGLPYFFLDFQFLSQRSSPIRLVGPPGLQKRCEALLRVTYPEVLDTHQWGFPLVYIELESGQTLDEGELRVEPFEMDHGTFGLSFGYRISWFDVLVGYTGDTRWNDRIPALARGCDVFLCDCFFFSSDLAAHIRYQDLLAHRSELEAKRTLLWHLGPEMLEHFSELDMDVAEDGMVLDLPE